jgi:hypothetical protein
VLDAAALQQENAALRAQLAQLVSSNATLAETIAKLNDRVAELLAIAQRKHRKPPAPKPPEPPPVVDGEERLAFEARPKPPELPPKTKTTRPRPPPTGRKALPAHLPVEEHHLRPDACGHCGSTALDAADELVEEKLHVVKEHQRRRVVKRTTCRCRACGGRTTPRSLPAPYPRSKVTGEWLAWLVATKFSLLTPLDRTRRDLKERGVPMAMGSLVSFIERAADLLAPIDGLHWQQLLASAWMATDGTGLKVLVPGLPAAHNGYIELYRNLSCAVFQYEADKGSEALAGKLQAFRGTLTADAEHRSSLVSVGPSSRLRHRSLVPSRSPSRRPRPLRRSRLPVPASTGPPSSATPSASTSSSAPAEVAAVSSPPSPPRPSPTPCCATSATCRRARPRPPVRQLLSWPSRCDGAPSSPALPGPAARATRLRPARAPLSRRRASHRLAPAPPASSLASGSLGYSPPVSGTRFETPDSCR